jgi:hypothetical protein
MKSKYRGHIIEVVRLQDGRIQYSITDHKSKAVKIDNTISGDSNVRLMLANCKLLIDDTKLDPLHEFFSEFVQ